LWRLSRWFRFAATTASARRWLTILKIVWIFGLNCASTLSLCCSRNSIIGYSLFLFLLYKQG
jgi:hypothetical protein